MKSKKWHAVGTVPQSNKIKYISNCLLSWLGKGISIKLVQLVL
jgi:hypothetical protein